MIIIVLMSIGVLIVLMLLLNKLTEEKCPKCKSKNFISGKWTYFASNIIIEGYYDNRKCQKCGHTWCVYADYGPPECP